MICMLVSASVQGICAAAAAVAVIHIRLHSSILTVLDGTVSISQCTMEHQQQLAAAVAKYRNIGKCGSRFSKVTELRRFSLEPSPRVWPEHAVGCILIFKLSTAEDSREQCCSAVGVFSIINKITPQLCRTRPRLSQTHSQDKPATASLRCLSCPRSHIAVVHDCHSATALESV